MPKPLATIHHLDLYGRRNEKYDTLETLSVQDAEWTELAPVEPYYFFVPKDFSESGEYEKGFKMNELFINFNTGIQTKCDELSIKFDANDLQKVVEDFQNVPIDELKRKYSNKEDSSGWNFEDATKDLKNNEIHYAKILYRPFDIRFTLFTGKSSGFIGRPRTETMRHFVDGPNCGLITLRINGECGDFVILATKNIVEKGSLPRGNYSVFPLYLYSDSEHQTPLDPPLSGGQNQARTPNLDETIWSAIDAIVAQNPDTKSSVPMNRDTSFAKEVHTTTPEQILDYIYAVLHCPSYREKYKEFLKIDFPRVPYPRDRESFLALVALGGELRSLHLLESSKVEDFITSYPVAGDNVVENVEFREPPSGRGTEEEEQNGGILSSINPPSSHDSDTSFKKEAIGKVFINATQYFGGVPESVWTHPIGGYMPAQKWLKDRKGRTLTNDDIMHYQRMIVALSETARVMGEVDRII